MDKFKRVIIVVGIILYFSYNNNFIDLESTGLNHQIIHELANGGESKHIRNYWSDPIYIVLVNVFRQILYEPLPDAVPDLDIALLWPRQEAALDIDYNLNNLRSAKIWTIVRAKYESTNHEAPNAKQFKWDLSSRTTSIAYYPMSASLAADPNNPYRKGLRILADRVLRLHANFIKEDSGLVLSRIINCKLYLIKYNPIGARYAQLPKFLAEKKAIINVSNHDNRCFGYAVLSAIKDQLPGHHKSEASYYTESDFKTHGLSKINYPVAVKTVPDLKNQLQTSFNLFSSYNSEGRGRYVMRVSQRQLPLEIDLFSCNNHNKKKFWRIVSQY